MGKKKRATSESLGPARLKAKEPPEGNSQRAALGGERPHCAGCPRYGQARARLQGMGLPCFAGMVKISFRSTEGKKRGPQDQLGPFIVLKVIKPPEGNSCCGGTGRKKPPKCISCGRYDAFAGIWQSFNAHASHAHGAGLCKAARQKFQLRALATMKSRKTFSFAEFFISPG